MQFYVQPIPLPKGIRPVFAFHLNAVVISEMRKFVWKWSISSKEEQNSMKRSARFEMQIILLDDK